jgi:hypothetical protein
MTPDTSVGSLSRRERGTDWGMLVSDADLIYQL